MNKPIKKRKLPLQGLLFVLLLFLQAP